MIELKKIEKVKNLTSDAFRTEFLEPKLPVLISDLMKDWPAKDKWTLDYFKEEYGHLDVPVFSPNASKAGKKYMQPDMTMPLREYIQKIQEGDTDIRLFLFNIFNHAPELQQDYKVPDIMTGFLKEFPFTFFGGAGSKVPMHFDLDMSNVFLSQFEGRKKVILFSPDKSKQLYHEPFTVASYVDVCNPDYEQFPAVSGLQGYECILEPGDTLFIPSGYWHYIIYMDAGFSMNQRANDSIFTQLHGVFNIATHYVVDRGMNLLIGEKWKATKEKIAYRRAEQLLKERSRKTA